MKESSQSQARSGLSVTFRGVRGSIPAPGAAFAGYGGETSCVEVVGPGGRVILDAGSGVRQVAWDDPEDRVEILFSHYHYDHLMGLPFFAPLHAPQGRLRLWGPQLTVGPQEACRRLMQNPLFPVEWDAVSGTVQFAELGDTTRTVAGFVVSSCPTHHPGGCLALRLEAAGSALVYAPDHEFGDAVADRALLELAADCDLLILDAQYLPSELAARAGWGHGSWPDAVRLAQEAGARRLALFHHDPSRTDGGVAAIECDAREHMAEAFAAREGETLQV